MGIAHRIVLTKTPDEVIAFFHREPKRLDDKHEKDGTPLIVCLKAGRTDVARALIELGANVNATDLYGHTGLMVAAEKGLRDITKLILPRSSGRFRYAA